MYYLMAAVLIPGFIDLIIYDRFIFSSGHGRAKKLKKGSRFNSAMSIAGIVADLILAIIVLDSNTRNIKPPIMEASGILTRDLIFLMAAETVFLIITFIISIRLYEKRLEFKNLSLEKVLAGGWWLSMMCMIASIAALTVCVISAAV